MILRIYPKPDQKRKKEVDTLHIFADEDHVHMQKPSKKRGKKNHIVLLVTVTEGIEKESKGRNITINAKHFTDEKFDTCFPYRKWNTD